MMLLGQGKHLQPLGGHDQLPDLTHGHVFIEVKLVPQGDCKCFKKSEKFGLNLKHVSYVHTKNLSTPGPNP